MDDVITTDMETLIIIITLHSQLYRTGMACTPSNPRLRVRLRLRPRPHRLYLPRLLRLGCGLMTAMSCTTHFLGLVRLHCPTYLCTMRLCRLVRSPCRLKCSLITPLRCVMHPFHKILRWVAPVAPCCRLLQIIIIIITVVIPIILHLQLRKLHHSMAWCPKHEIIIIIPIWLVLDFNLEWPIYLCCLHPPIE